MITPRKDEKAALVELLERDWDTPEALATAVLKEAFNLIQQRDLYGLAVDYAGLRVVYGPFATEGDTERAAKGLDGGVAFIGKMYAASGTTRPEDSPHLGACATCSHPKGTHDHPKSIGYCMAGATNRKQPACPCTQYVKESA